jgi:hypothetical protein
MKMRRQGFPIREGRSTSNCSRDREHHENQEKQMTEAFHAVLGASERERQDLFVGTGNRLGTAEQHIEKDFWVCWKLDALFNELDAGGPRLLFKGGTSLSKGYGLIERFSEDIDIIIFREDIGQSATVQGLEALSGKKRTARLDAIKATARNTFTARCYSVTANFRPFAMSAQDSKFECQSGACRTRPG